MQLSDNSDVAWQKYGQKDPYWGVLTDERFRKKNLTAESLKDFFASGDNHVSAVLTTLREHTVAELKLDDALDFGCGVGRIVIPLARHFKKVAGIDISDAYRSEAANNCLRENVSNAYFLETLHLLLEKNTRFDLVHSSIVFNHISWSRGQNMIADMFELLKPDGAMAVQVMIQLHVTKLRRMGSWLRENFLPFNWLVNTMRGRSVFEPLMQGNEYPLTELLLLLKDKGAKDFYIQLETVPEGHVFAFLFCRKDG